jgi:Flp pilus assembly pilin Flp
MKTIKAFLVEEQGQDLVEYTLLLAFVCMASAALFIGAGVQLSGIWSLANSRLVNGRLAAS